MLRRIRGALAGFQCVVLIGLLGACGGSSTEPNDGDMSLSATIDGSQWSANGSTTAANAIAGGNFTVVGADQNGRVLTLTVYNIGAPGTYPLGVGSSVFGGTGILSEGATSWWTPLSGAAGTVTITSVSATRLVGTFAFSAVPLVGTAGGTRSVTNGAFDVAVNSSGNVTVPGNAGSRFGGTLGGAAWNAATIVMVSTPASGTLALGASNDVHQLNITVSGFTGVATYTMNTGVARYVSVSNLSTGKTWGGSGATTSGSIVVTSVSAERIAGTYDLTVQPGAANPGTGDLTLTGTFDVGIS